MDIKPLKYHSALSGWHYEVALHGSGHNDFTDLTVFARQLEVSRQRRAAWSLGTIDAAEAVNAERTYVVNFFEQWLGSLENEKHSL